LLEVHPGDPADVGPEHAQPRAMVLAVEVTFLEAGRAVAGQRGGGLHGVDIHLRRVAAEVARRAVPAERTLDAARSGGEPHAPSRAGVDAARVLLLGAGAEPAL